MIVHAQAAHAGQIAMIEAECFGPAARSESSIREEIASAHRTHLIDGTRAYGVISVLGEVADLERIAVVPSARRQGRGRALLTALLEQAGHRGVRRILLEVDAANAGAIALYGSAGFEAISRRPGYYAGGADALVMQRVIG